LAYFPHFSLKSTFIEEKRILFVNAYFLIKMEGKNEKVTFWNNALGVGNCRSYPNDGSRYTR
jgi:hypothetical protein